MRVMLQMKKLEKSKSFGYKKWYILISNKFIGGYIMSEKKFTEEEMKKLRSIQQTYFEIQNSFGKVKIARMNLNTQIDDLDKAL